MRSVFLPGSEVCIVRQSLHRGFWQRYVLFPICVGGGSGLPLDKRPETEIFVLVALSPFWSIYAQGSYKYQDSLRSASPLNDSMNLAGTSLTYCTATGISRCRCWFTFDMSSPKNCDDIVRRMSKLRLSLVRMTTVVHKLWHLCLVQYHLCMKNLSVRCKTINAVFCFAVKSCSKKSCL